ncbi:MAG: hypothetical protein JNK28_04610 [Burkholderiaceae bacterium]|nr:hypothetical protein [Burkholderiaceae bacterium]
MSAATPLLAIKLLHTAVWAVFASAVLAIPVAAWCGAWGWAFGLIALVAGEVLVLLVNRMRCPLTDLAARYTDERQPNFDICLPRWLAQHNQRIFGTLYGLGLVWTAVLWLARP